MILERFSHSGIQSFKKCPAQFKYRYINQIYKKDEGIEAFLGKRVHESIEYLYNQAMVKNFISFDQLLNFYKSQWQEMWHNRVHIVFKKVLVSSTLETNKLVPNPLRLCPNSFALIFS